MTKDYYKILGVTEFETQDNIKSAYRKLARKFHPDVAGNSEEVLARFKEINEAYDVLSDISKKAEYDRARKFYSYAKNETYTQKETYKEKTEREKTTDNPQKKGFKFNWNEFVKQYEKQYKNESEKKPKKGEDVYADLEITAFEAVQGVEKVINMLQNGVCPKCGGRRFVNGTICTDCKGKGEISSFKKFTVKIPAGIKNNSKIRLAGEGGLGYNGGSNGDLYITIHVKTFTDYKTEGLNILKTVKITPYEAVLGSTVKIKGLNADYSVKITPCTQNGQKIRLSGCGIVQNDEIGDMILTVEIQIPKNISAEEIALYKKLSEISSINIRDQIYD